MCSDKDCKLVKRWCRFVAGLVLLASMVAFFSSGYSPPGIFGEVLRHNQANSIDASPLFYSEVENMAELEDSLRIMMAKKKDPTD